MSLSNLVKEHNTQQAKQKEKNEQKRQQTLDSLREVQKSLVLEVNQGIVQIFFNQQQLENESKRMHANSVKFSKQSTNWLTLFTQLNASVKELGDVENWANHIHQDVQGLVKSVDYILASKQKLQE
jgi:4-alpha-glucanotransferase